MLKFLSSFFLCFIVFLFGITSCFAFENIISSLNVDNENEYEIEVVAQNNEIYLPLKVILDLFNISFSENHAQKSMDEADPESSFYKPIIVIGAKAIRREAAASFLWRFFFILLSLL